MKKTAAVLAAAAALTMSVYASPQTEFTKGQWEINAGMWNTKAKTRTYKDNSAWNFNGGVTYGLTDKAAAQFQYYGLNSDDTDGRSHELNLLYSVHPQVAVYTGYNHITMSDFPIGAFGAENGRMTSPSSVSSPASRLMKFLICMQKARSVRRIHPSGKPV